jgi:hypothetical protein
LSDVFTKHLPEPLPYDTVDTNIEHEAGKRSPLCDSTMSPKR